MTELLMEMDSLARYVCCSRDARSIPAPVRRKVLLKICKALVDPYPEDSLRISEKSPPSFYDERISFGGSISPQQKWRQLRNLREHLPRPCRLAGAAVLGKSSLPRWEQLQALTRAVGFKAVPVIGYMGGPLYFTMIERRELPCCTKWLSRPALSPRHLAIVDPIHDIGHVLALGMPDYRRLILRFVRAVRKNSVRLDAKKVEDGYVRLFERAYVIDSRSRFEPIGAVACTFEWPRFVEGKPLIEPRAGGRKNRRPFISRAEWRQETERFIRKIEAGRL